MRRIILFPLLFFITIGTGIAAADNIYELRKLTEDDWLAMTTEERLSALSTASRHERNQTFLGDFGRNQDLYKRWGYEFYEMEDRYENYAFRNFEAYNIIEERRRRWSYNEFGDRIAKMRHNARIWTETYYGDDTYDVEMPYYYINSAGSQTGYVDGVWVAREGTDDWAISVTGAGALRTKFTPLSFSIPNINGMSIDFQSANSSLKAISSVAIGPASAYGGVITYLSRQGAMLRGGRFRRKFGALTLGASYATAYGVQANRQRGHEWRGSLGTDTPSPLVVAVRFLDDSPEDGEGGPIVYDIRLKIDGKYRDDIIPQILIDDVTRDRTTAITDKLDAGYLEPSSTVYYGDPKYEFQNTTTTMLKYADIVSLNDMIKGHNTENINSKFGVDLAKSYYTIVDQGGKSLQVSGNETLVYLFDISSITTKVNRIEAEARVANDYRIQTSMMYTVESRGGHDSAGKTTSWYDATYWDDMAVADGNIKDGSNLRTVSIDFGLQVAKIIYGLDMQFNYRGFRVKGEYVTDTTHYMYPDG